jgi:hypothetical protein
VLPQGWDEADEIDFERRPPKLVYPPCRFIISQIRNIAPHRDATMAANISHSDIAGSMPLEHSRLHMQIR